MHVRLDGYARARASLGRRATALVATSAIALLASAFFGLAMIVALASSAKEIETGEGQRRMLIAFLALVALVFLAPGALLLRRGLASFTRARRLSDLSLLARRQAVTSSGDVARSLRLPPADADRLVRDAAALGVVELPPVDPLAATIPAAAAGAGADAGLVLNDTYRLEAALGAGAMGTVHAARHLRTGRAYAIKLMRPDGRSGDDLVRRFQREAAAAGALGHASIVAVHDVDVTPDGIRYLVMDLLRGETLAARLAREKSLPFAEARRVALDVADALGAAHAAGLLHRDVKPANVFLAEIPGGGTRAVLLDFGLVKQLDDAAASRLTHTGAAVGTPLYMSPEQARGEPLDVRSDVYALGAVLYEMLTGAPPFAGETVARLYARLLHDPPPRPSALGPAPDGLDALSERALAKRREDRFDDIRAFAEALARIA